MRIESLNLRDFRCFADQQVDLSADVTAIHGRNGVGKTTIFDAIELALTGQVDHLDGYSDNTDPWSRVSGSDNPIIKLSMSDQSENIWIKYVGTRGDPAHSSFSSSYGDPNVSEFLFQRLLNPDYSDQRRTKSFAVDLLRASLLLTQDEIRGFIETEPENRTRILSALGGSALLQRRLKKARAVLDEASKRQRSVQQQVNSKKPQLDDLRRELGELEGRMQSLREQIGDDQVDTSQVLTAFREAGIDLPDGISHEEIVCDLQIVGVLIGMCNSRLEHVRKQREDLAVIDTRAEEHAQRLVRWIAVNRDVELATKEEETRRQVLKQAQDTLAEKDETVRQISTRLKALRDRKYKLEQMFSIREQIKQMRTDAEELLFQQAETQKAVESARMTQTEIQQELVGLQASISESRDLQSAAESRQSQLNKLLLGMDDYETAVAEDRTLKVRCAELATELTNISDLITELETRIADIQEEVRNREYELASRKSLADELGSLITRISDHVEGAECPLCGHDHGVPDSLQMAMRAQLTRIHPEITASTRLLQESTDKLKHAELTCNERKTARDQLRADLDAKRSRQAQLHELYRAFEQQIASLNIEPNHVQLRNAIHEADTKVSTHRDTCTSLTEMIRVLTDKKKDYTEQLNTSTDIVDDLASRLSKTRAKIVRFEEQLSTIGFAPVDMGLAGEDLITAIAEAGAQIDKIATEYSALVQQQEMMLSGCNDCMNDLQNQQQQKKRLEVDRQELARDIENYRTACKGIGLPADACIDEVDKQRALLDRKTEKIYSALHIVELAKQIADREHLDNETQGIRQRVASLEREIAENNHELLQLQKAEATAVEWVKLLSRSVNGVVDDRIYTHAPTINRLFKSMIPAPYHFDKIRMDRIPSDGGIRLGLVYRSSSSSAGEPRYFLSSAQANVLALSVFLAISTNQQASRLQTILLDDPVQHLDDLDAVAFLDTLRIVALGGLGTRKQVIMSTCDKELYLMVLRKFAPLSHADKLRVTGISLLEGGINGPDLCYDMGGPDNRRLFDVAG